MKNASMSHKITVSVIGMILLASSVPGILLTLLFLLGCGKGEEEAKEKTEMEAQYIDKGTCAVGLTLKPGESCSYFGSGEEIVFSVRQDGFGCRSDGTGDVLEAGPFKIQTDDQTFCVNYDIESDDLSGTNFAASKNPDGSWTVNRDGSLPFVIKTGNNDTSLVIIFEDAFQAREHLKAYDVQWRTKTPQGSWSTGCFKFHFSGFIFIDGQIVTVTGTISGLEPRTTYQVRYRDTNRETCVDLGRNTHGPWSPIGEGTTSGGQ